MCVPFVLGADVNLPSLDFRLCGVLPAVLFLPFSSCRVFRDVPAVGSDTAFPPSRGTRVRSPPRRTRNLLRSACFVRGRLASPPPMPRREQDPFRSPGTRIGTNLAPRRHGRAQPKTYRGARLLPPRTTRKKTRTLFTRCGHKLEDSQGCFPAHSSPRKRSFRVSI
jgi:hypothetical protein